MSAGSRRTYLTIQHSTATKDGLGADVRNWSEFAKVWAQVSPIKGNETFSGSQFKSEVTHKVKIRFLEGLTTRMRILLNGRVLSIEGITNLYEKNRELEILASENV